MIRVKRNDVMSYECQELQNAANDVDLTLEERDEAAEQLERLADAKDAHAQYIIGTCLLYTSPSPRDTPVSRMPSSA